MTNEAETVQAAIYIALLLVFLLASGLLAYGAWYIGSRLFPSKRNHPTPTNTPAQPDDEYFSTGDRQ